MIELKQDRLAFSFPDVYPNFSESSKRFQTQSERKVGMVFMPAFLRFYPVNHGIFALPGLATFISFFVSWGRSLPWVMGSGTFRRLGAVFSVSSFLCPFGLRVVRLSQTVRIRKGFRRQNVGFLTRLT